MCFYRNNTCFFFHTLTFAGSRGSCLNTRPIGGMFKHLPRDQVSVKAMKQTCVIVILAYFTWFRPIPHWKRYKTIKTSIFLHWISLNKLASTVKLSNAIMSSQRHSRVQRFREQKHWQNNHSGRQRFLHIMPCNYLGAYLKYFKVQTHVQTARESPDLNMDFRSFDNGLKQL